MASPISGETMPRKAFCLVSSQICDQLLGIQDHIIGPLRALSLRAATCSPRTSWRRARPGPPGRPARPTRSWSKVATPTTRPSFVHADRDAGGREHGRVERGPERVVADGERVPEAVGRHVREPGIAVAVRPAARPTPSRAAVRSASLPTTRIHGSPVLTAAATVAVAGSTGPADSDSPSVRKNDSRLMPRSNPTNPAT